MGVKKNWEKAALAEELNALSLDMTGVSDKIGDTTDAAADAPTSVFSGIKRILQWFSNTWTAARAAKVDTIENNVKTINNNVNTIATTGGLRPYGDANIIGIETTTGYATKTKSTIFVANGKGKVKFCVQAGSDGETVFLDIVVDGVQKTVNTSYFYGTSGQRVYAEIEFSSQIGLIVYYNGNGSQHVYSYDISYQYRK